MGFNLIEMDIETLDKANELNREIAECTKALNCFQWEEEYGGHSTRPRLIIEFDGPDGRETQVLPMYLSDDLVSILKAAIVRCRDVAVAEFKAL